MLAGPAAKVDQATQVVKKDRRKAVLDAERPAKRRPRLVQLVAAGLGLAALTKAKPR